MFMLKRLLLVGFAVGTSLNADAHARQFATVRTGIEMTLVGTPYDTGSGHPAVLSPDGRRAAVVTYRGDVSQNTLQYRILLFQRRRDGRFGRPAVTMALSSQEIGNKPGISTLRWSRDSRILYTLAADDKGITQLFTVDLSDGRRSAVTSSKSDLIDFATDASGRILAYIERKPIVSVTGQRGVFAGKIISSENIYTLLSGKSQPSTAQGIGGGNIVRLEIDGVTAAIDLPAEEWPVSGGMSVSPSGRYVVIPVAMTRSAIPASWSALPLPVHWDFFYGLRAYDRVSGELRWLYDGPVNWKNRTVTWSRDEQSALITALLVSQADGQVPQESMAVVDVATGISASKFPGDFEVVNPDAALEDVQLIDPATDGRPYSMSRLEAEWVIKSIPSQDWQIILSQSMNQAPLLMQQKEGAQRLLLDLNPEMTRARLNHVQQYRWKNSAGVTLTCGLYMPRGFKKGFRYPLIIQTHGWTDKLFWFDGPSSAGFAAQSLADEGFLVAQIGGLENGLSTTREGSASADAFDTLIDALVREGWADDSRLGITAWSRTGFAVRSALAFGRHRFGAAVLVDSMNSGFLDYLLSSDTLKGVAERQMGAAPYGAGLDAWRISSPMFNFDRITAPVRLVKLGPQLLEQWEDWASARHLGNPIDFVWLPEANHWPILPLERLEIQQGAVDWYKFWLLDSLDPTDDKKAQYIRWQALKQVGR
ncbi:hypothetical protein KRZ98_04415 [Sphingobium sp. AS12]|uniref:S9 family peptidase n=1 Tax=Sphingobium sp. AS12 TaxID=2849495 RepID=UPI001C31CCDC|nr:hypothetical protein [Sphingobium sp. AS12]MBV2147530.1 hypothetical protein [Sphingobium sp. AS12]